MTSWVKHLFDRRVPRHPGPAGRGTTPDGFVRGARGWAAGVVAPFLWLGVGWLGIGPPSPAAERLSRWIALDAPVGHEHLATEALREALPGWDVDAEGNLVRILGEGSPTRVVACGLDRAGYVVSRITDGGYLRLHRAGRGSGYPLWDQAHEGQQVTVFTEGGPVPAVTAIANAHFSWQHRHETAVTTADDLWVDVGAASREEAEALGIRLLDPVARRLRAWSFADRAVGPDAGARAGCAALAAVAESAAAAAEAGAVAVGETDEAAPAEAGVRAASEADALPAEGRTVLLMTTGRTFGWVGLGAALARMEPVDALTILDAGEEGRDGEGGAAAGVDERRAAAGFGYLAPVLEAAGLDSVRRLAPPVRHPGTLVESVGLEGAAWLRARVAEAAGVLAAREATWPDLPVPPRAGAPRAGAAHAGDARAGPARAGDARAGDVPENGLAELAGLLAELADLPGVSGHEGRVREAVLAAMPPRARERAEVDSAGNVTVAFGPDRDTTVFIAHLDEVGWEVEAIAPDGTVTLRRRGGLIPRAWEGQPAVVYPRSGGDRTAPLRGVFVPREVAEERRPDEVRAWFGLDAGALAARGVAPGDPVLAHKEALRLGQTRFTARSLDDRAGTTALLMALRRLEASTGPPRETLPGKVVFAWSVEEETGLHGAQALARRLGAATTRVYSVDTFVSSDTPLESPHFAYAPLGEGPVLRAAESSSLTPPAGRERVRRIAREAGLRLQVGITQGGTDGTAFTFWGAPNAGLSWPGRYSHSPVEVLDLRDLVELVRLIEAVAAAPASTPRTEGGANPGRKAGEPWGGTWP